MRWHSAHAPRCERSSRNGPFCLEGGSTSTCLTMAMVLLPSTPISMSAHKGGSRCSRWAGGQAGRQAGEWAGGRHNRACHMLRSGAAGGAHVIWEAGCKMQVQLGAGPGLCLPAQQQGMPTSRQPSRAAACGQPQHSHSGTRHSARCAATVQLAWRQHEGARAVLLNQDHLLVRPHAVPAWSGQRGAIAQPPGQHKGVQSTPATQSGLQHRQARRVSCGSLEGVQLPEHGCAGDEQVGA